MEINEILAQLKSLSKQADETIASMKYKESQMFEEYCESLTNKIKDIYTEISPLLQMIGDGTYFVPVTEKVYGTKHPCDTPYGYGLILEKNAFNFGTHNYLGWSYSYRIRSDFDGFKGDMNTEYIRQHYKMLVDNWDAWKETVFSEFMKQYTERIEKRLANATEQFETHKEEWTFRE